MLSYIDFLASCYCVCIACLLRASCISIACLLRASCISIAFVFHHRCLLLRLSIASYSAILYVLPSNLLFAAAASYFVIYELTLVYLY